jgi:hypothetical protein
MEQLLLHLIGDYLLQPDGMANRKRYFSMTAHIHALIYAAPFILLTRSPWALWVIFISHSAIDHFGLARYLAFFKNWVESGGSILWADYARTGFCPKKADWMAVWLLIITDNTMHLIINYCAIRWL